MSEDEKPPEKRTTTTKIERVVPPAEPVRLVIPDDSMPVQENAPSAGNPVPEGHLTLNIVYRNLTDLLVDENKKTRDKIDEVSTDLGGRVHVIEKHLFGDTPPPQPTNTPSMGPITTKMKAVTIEQATHDADIRQLKEWQAKQMQTM